MKIHLTIIFGLILGCTAPKTITKINNPKMNMVLPIHENVVDIILAKENCVEGFDLCSDGYLQSFRGRQIFVDLNNEDFLSSYDTIYTLPYGLPIEEILRKNDVNVSNILDTYSILENTPKSLDSINFRNDKFCKKVKRYYKKSKIKTKATCLFSYKLYRMKLTIVYGGELELLLPDFNMKHKTIMKSQNCNVYYITSIHNIVPIK